MKTTKTYREFLKIERKYWKRHIRWVDKRGKIHSPKKGDYIWLDFIVSSPEKAMEVLGHKKHLTSNLKSILQDYLKFHSQPVRIDSTSVILIGVEITNEDYYWIGKNENGKVGYYSCVGGIKEI